MLLLVGLKTARKTVLISPFFNFFVDSSHLSELTLYRADILKFFGIIRRDLYHATRVREAIEAELLIQLFSRA